eukprot:1159955-Pelagomonas_calceolata.AAC.3
MDSSQHPRDTQVSFVLAQKASMNPSYLAAKSKFSILCCTATETFQPSIVFLGPRPGWYFTLGPEGQGYYKDTCESGSLPQKSKEEMSEVATQGSQGQGSNTCVFGLCL